MENYVTVRWLAMSSWHEAVFETYEEAEKVLTELLKSIQFIAYTDNITTKPIMFRAKNGTFLVQPQSVASAHIFTPDSREFWERYANFCQKRVKEIRDEISEVGFRAK